MSVSKSWVFLVIAGCFEVCWAIGLKYSDGFTKIGPAIFTFTTLALSMYLLGLAAQNLPIGTAYGVWVGIGSLGAAALGIILFQESTSPARLFFWGFFLFQLLVLK